MVIFGIKSIFGKVMGYYSFSVLMIIRENIRRPCVSLGNGLLSYFWFLGAAAELANRNSLAIHAYRQALALLREQRINLEERVGGEVKDAENDKVVWADADAVRLVTRNLARALSMQTSTADEAVGLLVADNRGDIGQVGCVMSVGYSGHVSSIVVGSVIFTFYFVSFC